MAGPRRLHIAYRPETDADGKVDGWIASLLDITEQSRAVQAREQLASIVESSGDAIVSKDLNGIIISWNKAAERLFGYAAEDVIGKSITILIPQELHDEEPKILERIRRGDSLDHYETIRQRKDGSRVPVSLSISPVKDAHGTIVGASKIARDITARKEAEHERDRIEGELRELSGKLEQEVERRTLERDRIWNVSEDLLGVVELRRLFPFHESGLEPAARLERGRDQGDACQRIAPPRRHRPFRGRPPATCARRADGADGEPAPPQGRVMALAAMDHDGG